LEELKNVNKKFREINEFFSPKIIAEVNDVFVKLVRIKGDKIPWHNHKDEDELFYVLEGELLMEVEGEAGFVMKAGDIYVVKRGMGHRISSLRESRIMLIENKSTAHTGEVKTAITRSIEEQL
jgi:mannose-6-phosphate isomerase-like protein (cupin superfamily)